MGAKTVAVKLSLSSGEIESIDRLVERGIAKNRADFCRKAVNGQIDDVKRGKSDGE